MKYYFFETSALAKRYKPVIELGANVVNKLYEEENTKIIIANITLVEIIRIIYRCVNEGYITRENLKKVISGFYRDLYRRGVIIVELTNNEVYLTSQILDVRMNLPGPSSARISPFDIMQIATVLNTGLNDLTVISADIDINMVLQDLKINVLNPNI